MKYFLIFIKSEVYRLSFFTAYIISFIFGYSSYSENASFIGMIASSLLAMSIALFPLFLIYCFIPLYQKFEEIVFFNEN
ncbi:hypothetical protein ADQ66_19020 [Salmonella enterica]|nr:hypothetical protein [Salmonella enterica]